MAKSKRKVYQTQRDKSAIAIAKKLKAEGVISKQAKLHGGKYISKEVLAKVKAYQDIARLNYTTVKVSKATAKAAKERGYQVVQGNRIIGPKTPRFKNRLKSGKLTGIKPVKGGYMEEVTLPHTIYDLRSLVNQLDEGGIDTLKMPHEQFAFKYKGNESYRAFLDSKAMLDYLLHYKTIAGAVNSNKPEDLQEEFDAITIFRLHKADINNRNFPTPDMRRKRRAERRAEAIRNGEYVQRKKRTGRSWSEKLDSIAVWKADKMREAKANAAKKYREALAKDPKKLEEYRAKARARAANRTKKGS